MSALPKSLSEQAEPAPEQQASGSSFYAAMRLLPQAEREAMFAIYAFCRKVDDIADDPGPTADARRRALDAWRADVASLYGPNPAPAVSGLVAATRRFGLAREDFEAVIDGMQMDVDGAIVAPPFEVLDLYCDRVASAVGRLSVCVFGMEAEPGRTLAHHLGRALQFTNILRDLDEDASMGRLYLPAEALAAAEIPTGSPSSVLADPRIDTACRWLAGRAHAQYRAAEAVLAARPAGRLRAPRLMAAVYGTILALMEANGWTAPRRRVSIPKPRLLWIALKNGLA